MSKRCKKSNLKVPKVSDDGGRGICETCLSLCRRVAPLGSLRRVYVSLMACDPRADPSACWECAALLRRAAQFRLRALRAQAWLHSSRLPGEEELEDVKPESSLRFTGPFVVAQIDPETTILASNDNKLETSGFYSDLEVSKADDSENNHEDCFQNNHEDSFQNASDYKYVNNESDVHSIETFPFDVESKIPKKKSKIKNETKTTKGQRKKSKTRTMSKLTKLCDSEVLHYREVERKMKSYQNAKYKCDTCILILKKGNYEEHMQTAHGLESYKYSCNICDVRLKSKSLLRAHIKDHYNLYSCFKCTFKSISKFRIRYHTEVMHKLNRLYQCTSCRMRFTDEIQLREHLELKKKRKGYVYECDVCGERLKTRLKMEKHLRSHEVNECSVCNGTFKTRYTLNLHYQRMHAVAPVLSEVYCVECNKQFMTTMAFTTHLATVHTSKPKPRIPCTDCDKTFSEKVYFNNHYQLIHLKKTKFYCEICNKYFSKKSGLKVHTMRVHEGVPVPKNDVCTICGRAFSSKVILKHHVRTHTGERPHKCEYCNAAFAQITAMKNHVKNIHLRISR